MSRLLPSSRLSGTPHRRLPAWPAHVSTPLAWSQQLTPFAWVKQHRSRPLLIARFVLVASAALVCVATSVGPSRQARAHIQMQANPATATSEVPLRFRRLVAQSAGESVRAVAAVRELETKQPGEGEVLIKVLAAGINGGCETFRARGERVFASLKGASDFALGSEGAGIVLQVGQGVSLRPGDAVAFVGSALSELDTVKESSCHRFGVASDLDPKHFREAAALRISGLTALVALELTGQISQGDVILITAAAGGTGHFAVQIAKLNGARVVATCSTDEKAEVLRSLGADRVVVYTKEDLSKVLDDEFPEGVDLVYEGVGGKLHTMALAHLKDGGRQLQVGYISHYPQAAGKDAHEGQGEELGDAFWGGKTWELPGNKTVYFNVWGGMKRATFNPVKRLFDLWAAADLKALIDPAPFTGLEQAPDAVEHMMSGQSTGKVVLRLP